MKVISCSTFHDADFSLKEELISALPVMKKLFQKSIVCCTPETNKEVPKVLGNEGFLVDVAPSIGRLVAYSLSIKRGLNAIEDPISDRIFYVDFDRLIHWANFHPKELEELISKHASLEYVHFGRSDRAFQNHPPTQIKTECIVNEVASKIIQETRTLDIISVSYMFTKSLGEKLLEIPCTTDMGFYAVWPIFFWSWTKKESRRYIECEGLEWETPDRFKKLIRKMGYENWLEQFKTAKEWEFRVKLLQECLMEMKNFADFRLK